VNINDEDTEVAVKIRGGESKAYHAFRTTDDNEDQYRDIGSYSLDESDYLIYNAPARSGTTFFAE
jgi:hypothetical protein